MVLVKSHRLKRKNDFERVFQVGRNIPLPFGFLKVAPNELAYSRFGIVVGSKISKKAVARNRLRRQVSEIFRTNLDKLSKGKDIVFVAKPSIVGLKYQTLQASILQTLK